MVAAYGHIPKHVSSMCGPKVRFLPTSHRFNFLVLSGCTVGPDFRVPYAPEVSGYTNDGLGKTAAIGASAGGQSQRFTPGSDVNPTWWTLFRSKQLDAFVEEAVRNHPDITAAQYALRAARETALAEQGGLVPQVSASASSTRERSAASGASPASVYSLHNASVDVSYALDVFGGTRREIEAKWAAADYQRFQLEATYLSLTANVVTAAHDRCIAKCADHRNAGYRASATRANWSVSSNSSTSVLCPRPTCCRSNQRWLRRRRHYLRFRNSAPDTQRIDGLSRSPAKPG